MHPFAFRLEQVAQVRAAQRDDKREKLARARQAAQELADQRTHIQRRLEQLNQQIRRAAAPGCLNADFLRQAAVFAGQLQSRQTQLERQYQAARRKVELCQGELLAAQQQWELLDKLRQRQAASHQRQADRVEQQRQDETAARR